MATAIPVRHKRRAQPRPSAVPHQQPPATRHGTHIRQHHGTYPLCHTRRMQESRGNNIRHALFQVGKQQHCRKGRDGNNSGIHATQMRDGRDHGHRHDRHRCRQRRVMATDTRLARHYLRPAAHRHSTDTQETIPGTLQNLILT